MDLIIVESPTKARTLTRFLKGKYKVEATMGHIRDLPKSEFGIDLEHNFEPSYIIPRDRMKRVRELKELAEKSDAVILATDPDREGEAIAWHIASLLAMKSKVKSSVSAKATSDKQKSKVKDDRETKSETRIPEPDHSDFKRIAFHEITESAIDEALKHPRTIDLKMVDAQQARRVLDRIVGYKLSPLLWQKLSRKWLSAGRVQSVAVRLIVEREREIAAFAKEDYWTITGEFIASHTEKNPDESVITAQLVSSDGKAYEKKETHTLFDGTYTITRTSVNTKEMADGIVADFRNPFTVTSVDRKEVKRAPPPPFTTSTLQQEAGRKLYFSAKKTMQVAQKLYEEGVITYHRTDSVNLSDKFLTEVRTYIKNRYGDKYLPGDPRIFHTKSKVAQEAHEAIRPTNPSLTSAELANNTAMNRDHVHVYELIWKRAVASQCKEAVFDSTVVAVTSANGYRFEARGSVIKFDGYLKIAGRDSDETVIPSVSEGQTVLLKAATPVMHTTAPPPRYSEASLVKTLEEKDIGRPSTYAPIISTIQERNYVTKEDKRLVPTELGGAVTDFLVRYFPEILNLPFTATMEDSLDDIANGKKEWVPVIRHFYADFSSTLDTAYKTAERVKMAVEETDEQCPLCGSPLVVRIGKYGKFIACSTFPKCTFTKQLLEKVDIKCPRCGSDIVLKKSRKGKNFYGCSNYPKCDFAAWKKEDIK